VLVDADSASVASGEAVSGVVNTPTASSNINLVVSDDSGQIIRQMSVPAANGESAFTWDGRDDGGKSVAAGKYTFKAIANVAGKNTSLTTSLVGKVSSVTIGATNSDMQLNTDELGSVQFGSVKKLY
jgi:flagellar basal-body rod modification protein FlgD